LKTIAPRGIDIFFDSTGGPMSEAALLHLNQYGTLHSFTCCPLVSTLFSLSINVMLIIGRVSICGQIAASNPSPNFNTLNLLLRKQATAQGFLSQQFKPCNIPISSAYLIICVSLHLTIDVQ
jgi:NADPH-dependent curcumin reductase CurA